jgi:hypothetical protein
MIHLIGNSHVSTFSNDNKVNMSFENEFFKSHYIGPVIAYNFYEHHMESVNKIINNVQKNDYISLIVGEVDCRVHLPLQADNQKNSDEEIVDECITRLFRCYDNLLERGYKVIVYSTHPTTTENHDMSREDRPIYGNVERRNNICMIWNKKLEILCKSKNIIFINFYDLLVNENNITKMDYFLDYCHLNSSMCYPFILEKTKNEILNNDNLF